MMPPSTSGTATRSHRVGRSREDQAMKGRPQRCSIIPPRVAGPDILKSAATLPGAAPAPMPTMQTGGSNSENRVTAKPAEKDRDPEPRRSLIVFRLPCGARVEGVRAEKDI